MNGQQGYRMGVGASSVLMIFVVLCMTTLGVLSFASARVNQTLTTRRGVQVEAYHTAAAKAQEALSQIDAALLEARSDPEGYSARVRAIEIPGVALSVSEVGVMSFAIPASETQHLQVAIRIMEPASEVRYQMVYHRLVNVSDWDPELLFWDFG